MAKDNLINPYLIVIVGNKCDVESRAVSFDEGLEKALSLNSIYLETSVKTGYNIDNLFEIAANMLMQD